MNDIYQSVILPKLPTVRQRLPFKGTASIHMTKLERGLVQRSILYCFDRGYFSLIRYLLESGGGNVRERDSEGRTGLMYCCFIDNDASAQSIAMTLLEYGARIEDQDQRGLNALHYAIITQRLILVERYLTSLDFDLNQTVDIHGNTCLHYACSIGNADIVRLILNRTRRSIDLTITNYCGATAYDIACQLKHERCQNLLRNEITFRERPALMANLSTTANVSLATIESLNERRSSIQTRLPPIKSRTNPIGSLAFVPPFISEAKRFRKRFSNASMSNNENVLRTSSIFIDPIESRNIKLRRNESLDAALVNQARNRSDFAPSSVMSQSIFFSSPPSLSSPSTWRDDFSKVFDQFQKCKTPSYRKSAYPPLATELSCELFEKLYGMAGEDGHDCSHHQPLTPLTAGLSTNLLHQRRSSTNSVKSVHKTKK